MAKNWWFKFDFTRWRTDSDLRRCSLETRAFWLEVLCVMHEADTWKLEGTYEELGWLIGCSPEIVGRCSVELGRTKTADVTLGNGFVTLVSRRLKREAKDREDTKLRVRKSRGNGDVTDAKQSPLNKQEVISKEKEEDIQSDDASLSFAEQVIGGIQSILGILQLPNESAWFIEIERAQKNSFTVEHCLETFSLMHKQKWRTSAIKAATWYETLPILNKLRDEANNGTTRPPSEREKSAQRTINAELMANAIRDGDEAALKRILGSDGQDHSKGYLSS